MTVGKHNIIIEPVEYLGDGVYQSLTRSGEMRIDDSVLEAVCYVTYGYSQVAGQAPQFKLAGTAFFVRFKAKTIPKWFTFVVTAKHVIDGARGRSLGLLVNGAYNTLIHISLNSPKFYMHPTDDAADVAIAWMPTPNSLSISALNLDVFLGKNDFSAKGISLGDEVYMVGLFQKAPGKSRNLPIVRHGNLAMIPRDRLSTSYGDAEVYLIEARSIGGISGSPVFVRQTIDANINKPDGSAARLSGLGGVYCLGVVHGHWDVGVDQLNKVLADSEDSGRSPGVNLGIGIITPAYKVLETLNHPEVVELMKEMEEQDKKAALPKMDTATEDDFTREDFENALKRASRKIDPSQSGKGKSETSE